MRACGSSWWSAFPDTHGVWLCSHRLQPVADRAGVHTLYAYGRFAHTLSVSWDTPPCGIVPQAPTLLEVCLMRSPSRSDLLYEAAQRDWSRQSASVCGL